MEDADPLRGRCAAAGIGVGPLSRESRRSVSSRAAQQDNAATADPGLATAAVDDIVPCEQDALQQNDLVDVLGLAELSQRGLTSSGGSAPTGMVGLPCAAVTADLPKAVPLTDGRSGTLYGSGHPAEHSGKNGSYDKSLSCTGLRCLSTRLRYATSSNASRLATSGGIRALKCGGPTGERGDSPFTAGGRRDDRGAQNRRRQCEANAGYERSRTIGGIRKGITC